MNDEQFVSIDEAAEAFGSTSAALGAEAPEFTSVDLYTTFKAEYAVIGADLIFHFFATEEVNKLPDPWRYWKRSFPDALQVVATEHFGSSYPRIKAAYSEDLASWWLRANGYEQIMDLNDYAKRFLAKLDAALDSAVRGAG